MGALPRKTPIESYTEEQQPEFFLINENHIAWKVAVPVVTFIIGFILSTGIVNG